MARPTKITGMDVTPFPGVKIQKVGAIYTRTLEEGGTIYLEKGVKSRTFCAVATGKTTIGCTSRRIWGALALAAAQIPWDFHKLSSWSRVGRCLLRSQAYPARFSPKLIVGTSILYGCTVHTAYQLGFKPFYRKFSRSLTTIFNSKDLFDPFLFLFCI